MAKLTSYATSLTVTQLTGHVVTIPINYGEKLEKFNNLNFERWQQKNVVLPDYLKS